MKTLTPVIHKLDFYVNWDKVFIGVEKYKIELGILNTMCGSSEIENEFRTILRKYPEVVQVFSLLIGVRGDKIQVLKDINDEKFSFLNYEFKKKKSLYPSQKMDISNVFLLIPLELKTVVVRVG